MTDPYALRDAIRKERSAISDAKQNLDCAATIMASSLTAERIRFVDTYELVKLKRVLARFDAKRRRWRAAP